MFTAEMQFLSGQYLILLCRASEGRAQAAEEKAMRAENELHVAQEKIAVMQTRLHALGIAIEEEPLAELPTPEEKDIVKPVEKKSKDSLSGKKRTKGTGKSKK